MATTEQKVLPKRALRCDFDIDYALNTRNFGFLNGFITRQGVSLYSST